MINAPDLSPADRQEDSLLRGQEALRLVRTYFVPEGRAIEAGSRMAADIRIDAKDVGVFSESARLRGTEDTDW